MNTIPIWRSVKKEYSYFARIPIWCGTYTNSNRFYSLITGKGSEMKHCV